VCTDESVVQKEREELDRKDLKLSAAQLALVKDAVAAASTGGTKKPVVVVLMCGGANIDISALVKMGGVEAILWIGYPGQSGGDALGDALFGVTNSFGKLPVTWYDRGRYDYTLCLHPICYPIYTIHYILCPIRYTLYTIRCTIYDIHCTLYAIHYTHTPYSHTIPTPYMLYAVLLA
jgi:hypothetical protein